MNKIFTIILSTIIAISLCSCVKKKSTTESTAKFKVQQYIDAGISFSIPTTYECLDMSYYTVYTEPVILQKIIKKDDSVNAESLDDSTETIPHDLIMIIDTLDDDKSQSIDDLKDSVANMNKTSDVPKFKEKEINGIKCHCTSYSEDDLTGNLYLAEAKTNIIIIVAGNKDTNSLISEFEKSLSLTK